MPLDDSPIRINSWAHDLYQDHGSWRYDFVLIYGGRGSSKTVEISQALVVKAAKQKLRITVAREVLDSIRDSAYKEITERIVELGIPGFRVLRDRIIHENGSEFLFIGLSKVSEERIKGLALVDIVWVEEAHRMSHSSWELLRPTIRKEMSQIWASWNPKYRTDAIDSFCEEVVKSRDPHVWVRKINWSDNAYFPEKSNRERLRDLAMNPDRYPHIWEGEYDDVSDKRKVLPYALLQKCVDAWDRRPTDGVFVDGGLDVADTGLDLNALTLSCGASLFDCQTWRGSHKFTLSDTARKAKGILDEYDSRYLFYDAGGVGAGIRGPIMEAEPEFNVRGINFGGKVDAPTAIYVQHGGKTARNEQYFQNWGAQAGWVLRLRANNTEALLQGNDIDIDKCLFINPEIRHLKDMLSEMAQPEWNQDTGKLKIDKQPREAGEAEPPSPDRFDSARLAFARDAGKISRLLRAEN